MKADCTKCRYFIDRRDMTQEQHKTAEEVARLRRYPTYWGWCRARDKPVLYLTGYCPHYDPKLPRYLIKLSNKQITDYLNQR